MTPSIRELLTELAWIEDSIRHVPLTSMAVGPTRTATDEDVNPDLIAMAERERQIISDLRAAHVGSAGPGA